MTNDELIPIEITKSRVERIAIFYKENELPEWQAEVALITHTGQRLTSIWVQTDAYPADKCAERSPRFLSVAKLIRNEVNVLVTQHINKFQKVLEAK